MKKKSNNGRSGNSQTGGGGSGGGTGASGSQTATTTQCTTKMKSECSISKKNRCANQIVTVKEDKCALASTATLVKGCTPSLLRLCRNYLYSQPTRVIGQHIYLQKRDIGYNHVPQLHLCSRCTNLEPESLKPQCTKVPVQKQAEVCQEVPEQVCVEVPFEECTEVPVSGPERSTSNSGSSSTSGNSSGSGKGGIIGLLKAIIG